MADETNEAGSNGEQRGAEVNKLIDKAMGELARQPSPMRAQRELAWSKMAKASGSPDPCRLCGRPSLMTLNSVCRDCFLGGGDARPAVSGVQCGFCARRTPATPEDREPTQFLREGESVIRGAAGGVICSTCAATAAGCMGAKSDVEARRMMAMTALQSQAVKCCDDCLKLIEKVEAETVRDGFAGTEPAPPEVIQRRAELLLTLGEAAEAYARIARGDR